MCAHWSSGIRSGKINNRHKQTVNILVFTIRAFDFLKHAGFIIRARGYAVGDIIGGYLHIIIIFIFLGLAAV